MLLLYYGLLCHIKTKLDIYVDLTISRGNKIIAR